MKQTMTASIRQYQDISYIRLDSLPDEEREPFHRWIQRQTRPVIPNEFDGSEDPAPCAYAWDYARWLSEGKPGNSPDPYDT